MENRHDDKARLSLKELSARAQEIIATRSSWFFHGIFAEKSRLPDGVVSSRFGSEVSYQFSPGSKDYYQRAVDEINPNHPLLYCALRLNLKIMQKKEYADKIVVWRVPTKEQEREEVVITGASQCPDNRGSFFPYSLTQQLDKKAVDVLFDTLKREPQFIEIFYKTAFPDLDSEKDKYTGLYRLLADKLMLIEASSLQEFVSAHSDKDVSHFRNDVVMQFIQAQPELPLTVPTGVGATQDFPEKQSLRY